MPWRPGDDALGFAAAGLALADRSLGVADAAIAVTAALSACWRVLPPGTTAGRKLEAEAGGVEQK